MANILEMKNINKEFYTKDGTIKVIEDLSFSLKEGSITAMIGPSGCGKSTILNILSGLIEKTAGSLEIHGKIGYMFQKDHLFDWLTIYDNVTLGLKIQKNKQYNEFANHLLKKYDLWEFRNRYPKELSGGMRQRVALIRTLVVNPDILLLDEPFSALDAQTKLKVSQDIYHIIKEEKKTTLIVTHDLAEALSFSDDIIVLTKRPTSINSFHSIHLTLNEEKTPINARTAPEFRVYFDEIWKELEKNE